MSSAPAITVYGAAWCSETVDGAPERAQQISDRMNIPVVVYPDAPSA